MSDIYDVIKELNREFGERTVVTMDEKPVDIPRLSTGSIGIDRALGGGIPLGRVIEIYGPEGAGKTTLALEIVAETQKTDVPVVYIDMEHALDRAYAEAIGVDTSTLLISQPDTGTAALKIAKKMIGHAGLIVIDSVPGLVTQAELDADPGDNHVGVLARLMSQNLKTIIPPLGLSDTALVFVNQLRMKIGIMFGNPETTPGGRALKFWSSVRMEIRRKGYTGPKDARTGQVCVVKAAKNKVAAPFRSAEITIDYGKGIDKWADLLAVAVEEEQIEKKGSFYYYQEENIGQGTKNAEAWLTANPAEVAAIREAILNGKEKDDQAT